MTNLVLGNVSAVSTNPVVQKKDDKKNIFQSIKNMNPKTKKTVKLLGLSALGVIGVAGVALALNKKVALDNKKIQEDFDFLRECTKDLHRGVESLNRSKETLARLDKISESYSQLSANLDVIEDGIRKLCKENPELLGNGVAEMLAKL